MCPTKGWWNRSFHRRVNEGRRGVATRSDFALTTRSVDAHCFSLLHPPTRRVQSLKPKVMNKLKYKFYMKFTKVNEGVIEVPVVPYEIDSGIYLIKIRGRVRKVGEFGSGASGAKARFSTYRTVGKRLVEFYEDPGKKVNGSVITMKMLNEVLEVGESIDIYVSILPGLIEHEGLPYTPSTTVIEKREKERFSKGNKLWLK